MVKHEAFTLLTENYNEMINITKRVLEAVKASGIKEGLVAVITKHTTTGITVNECLECLESDIDLALKRLVPEDIPYCHARMLHTYGSTAGNPTGHIKSMLVGNSCMFPIIDGEVSLGGAQDIYFYEFDGPARRTINITVIGEN
ncbi:MAG: secondary thiamine-phosphate synthase enzyme YjbQ [Bacillota bacterium]|nr:secondary thiamine-phosphate synthase enzyme YjbQ [Bacillota bacterium]